MLSAGSAVAATQSVGRERVEAAILTALAPWRSRGGSYRLKNEWHHLICQMR
jgi:hypothetical protein